MIDRVAGASREDVWGATLITHESVDRTYAWKCEQSRLMHKCAEFSTRGMCGLVSAHIAWPGSVFAEKQVSGPRTVKSQPIWIKFCTHLLLYGIHLRADLDRDRREGGSKPKRLCFL